MVPYPCLFTLSLLQGCPGRAYHLPYRNNSCPRSCSAYTNAAHAAPSSASCEFDDRYFKFPSRVLLTIDDITVYNTPGWKSSPAIPKTASISWHKQPAVFVLSHFEYDGDMAKIPATKTRGLPIARRPNYYPTTMTLIRRPLPGCSYAHIFCIAKPTWSIERYVRKKSATSCAH